MANYKLICHKSVAEFSKQQTMHESLSKPMSIRNGGLFPAIMYSNPKPNPYSWNVYLSNFLFPCVLSVATKIIL